jgi:DNA processing protein
MKVNKVSINASAFPEVLRHIADPPKELYILGNLSPLLEKPRLAVVGSRKVTPYGRAVTSDLVREAAGRGVVIVSGLALGVDALAHEAALEAGGYTVAVLACGLDKPHPTTNLRLARRILEKGGALISEYPEGTPPLAHQFIARNRLVSGLSDGVLITEAAEKSGTIHTAGFALEQGRTVMAVPGNITSTQSAGTNNLIKAGATPVTTATDILQSLGLDAQTKKREVLAADANEAVILELLKTGISDSNELQALSHLDPSLFNQTLTMLEITGKIRPTGAGHWSIN